jgi:putative transposase
MARAVVPGIAHHLTQRGVDRRDVFPSDEQREVYLRLAALSLKTFEVRALAYCLMSNHVHWVVIPPSGEALARAFGFLHGRYAQHVNAALGRSGHFWQNRFFSCALDEPHSWAAIRYVEGNPVRAGLVAQAEQWGWSSAGVRLGLASSPVRLDLEIWQERFTAEEWRVMLAAESLSEAEDALRARTYTGRPAGTEEFVRQAEETLSRALRPRKGGGRGRASLRRGSRFCSWGRALGRRAAAENRKQAGCPRIKPY